MHPCHISSVGTYNVHFLFHPHPHHSTNFYMGVLTDALLVDDKGKVVGV